VQARRGVEGAKVVAPGAVSTSSRGTRAYAILKGLQCNAFRLNRRAVPISNGLRGTGQQTAATDKWEENHPCQQTPDMVDPC
jgi:hypothetical protein